MYAKQFIRRMNSENERAVCKLDIVKLLRNTVLLKWKQKYPYWWFPITGNSVAT